MSKQTKSLHTLAEFLPENTLDFILPYFKQYPIYLTITRERKSVHGDYRNPTKSKPYHRISINGNLNPYSFLITLVHELAHMLAYIKHKHTIKSHGQEWKKTFSNLLQTFLEKRIFPQDVETALLNSIEGVKAATCNDLNLYKALLKYDSDAESRLFIEDIEPDTTFVTEDGRSFTLIKKMRTRYQCKEIKTGRLYSFHSLAEIKLLH